MARTMYDSTHASAIPTSAAMVMGYGDGSFKWSAADWARFPNARKVVIVVNPATNAGDLIDVEPGNWPASYVPGWLTLRRQSGAAHVGVYCTEGTDQGYDRGAILGACQNAGVAPPAVWLVANYDGVAVIPAGCIGKQYANSAMTGGDYDLSVVADYWPGVDPAPDPPIPVGGKKLYIQFQATVVAGRYKGVPAQFVSDGMRFRWIQNPGQLADVQGLLGASLVQHTPGVSVTDPLAFGLPADAVTAAMLGLSFGAELGDF